MYEVILYLYYIIKNTIFYNFYFFWISYWTEILLCQIFLLYFIVLLYYSLNIYKNIMYTTFILLYTGLYIMFLEYDIFVCFLWIFESTILLLIYILSLVFKNNINFKSYYNTNRLIYIYILLFFFLFFSNIFYYNFYVINIKQVIFFFYLDIYMYLKNFYTNDLVVLFVYYYYFNTVIIYNILLIILVITYFIILFFKLFKKSKLTDYLYYWKHSNKVFKKQSYEQQSDKKINLKNFFKK